VAAFGCLWLLLLVIENANDTSVILTLNDLSAQIHYGPRWNKPKGPFLSSSYSVKITNQHITNSIGNYATSSGSTATILVLLERSLNAD
jgi:hypothetical protein